MKSDKKLFRLATLGCRTNQYETQAFRDQLLGLGLEEAKEGESADFCIVNTCTVTQSADRSSRQQIRALKKQNPDAELVITGCLADRKPDEIGNLGRAVANAEKERLITELFPEEDVPEFAIKQFDGQTRAFVKVQDGCNSFCTYCIIPYVRGRSRSRSIDEVVCEVRQLVEKGFKEVVITGIDVGDFEGGIASLMRAVDGVDGLKRLRLSSIDPNQVDEELMEVILQGKTTCHSLHLVLQSGSDKVLKRMNRNYTRQMFFDRVENLRKVDPEFSFTTDIIVGFPGESEKDFKATQEVVERVGFIKVHMFPFSARERTRAALYPDKIKPEVINERKQRLLELADQIAFEQRGKWLEKKVEVLTENRSGGHTDRFLDVSIPEGGIKPNELVEVTIVENSSKGLVGKL